MEQPDKYGDYTTVEGSCERARERIRQLHHVPAKEQPSTAYDYQRQTWLKRYATRFDGAWIWRVPDCAHPESMRPNCCYAGEHIDELVVHHDQIH